ncbi:MAG: Dihydrolipoyllysine-residue succinyltransferase component of 2-oxoglutarate dehydrogenase complex [Alphaproteobacteria bacterium MarineAlpha3_Bin6]|nr:MAG: Dihydrolipoyllysine-residue succinyltransferase component of 2-oxoglutarate dehydrogenase complex [Alphaproteobacteria bacterium MarineAlpha3_Bin6]
MDVLMPQLGETVAEGTLSIWHKNVGERVEANELLFEISTDKVEMEVPAPAGGVMKEILVKEGETVEVGAILAILDDGTDGSVGPIAPEPAPSLENNAQHLTHSLPAASPSVASAAVSPNHDPRRRLSPVVRKLVAEHNLNPDNIDGSGLDGRIKKSDVLALLQRNAPTTTDQASGSSTSLPSVDGKKVIPFNRIRRVTAEHMVRSKSTSPHVHQGVEVDFSRVDRVRSDKGVAWRAREGFSLNYLPFVARAVCDAIVEFPHVNAHVEENSLVVYDQVNLAIAVDLNFEGLVAPVIQNASSMTAVEIARSIAGLAARARANQLTPGDHLGATYTISNNGSFGTLFTTPIINQPQVAILSTDSITKRPVVVEQDGEDHLVIRPVGIVTQAFDHRAIDGAYAAAFLRKVKEIIETKNWEAALP